MGKLVKILKFITKIILLGHDEGLWNKKYGPNDYPRPDVPDFTKKR